MPNVSRPSWKGIDNVVEVVKKFNDPHEEAKKLYAGVVKWQRKFFAGKWKPEPETVPLLPGKFLRRLMQSAWRSS